MGAWIFVVRVVSPANFTLRLKLSCVVSLVWFTVQSAETDGENDFPDRIRSLLENSIEIVL